MRMNFNCLILCLSTLIIILSLAAFNAGPTFAGKYKDKSKQNEAACWEWCRTKPECGWCNTKRYCGTGTPAPSANPARKPRWIMNFSAMSGAMITGHLAQNAQKSVLEAVAINGSRPLRDLAIATTPAKGASGKI